MDKDFWTAKGSRNLDVGEMTYNKSSRLEQKRSQRWFLDSSDTDIIPNKKQIVEFPGDTSFSGLLTSTTSHWKYASNSAPVTGHFHERPFDPETERGMNFDHWNASSVGISTMNLGRKVLEDQFENSSSCNHNSGLDYSGIRKVKVSQVNDSENYMSAALERFCASGDSDLMPLSHPYSKSADASLTMGLPFNKKDESALTNTFNREDDSLISMGESYNEDDCHISIGQSYKIDNDPMIKSYFLNKDDTDVLAMMDNDAFKDRDDVMPVVQSFSKNDNNVMSIGQIFNKEIDATLCIGQTDINADVSTFSLGHTCNSMSNMGLPMGLSFSNGESSSISFGGLNDNEDGSPGEGLECSHDLLMVQSSVLNSEALNQKQLIESNADLLASDSQMISHVDSFPHKKVEQKANRKAPLNNFPSNVKSLLSTGIFDGVPVKYVSWSRETELHGKIKGSGYLCGCHLCNFSKVINAYEYERHAGCKTKHPNNHIYFDNGKTVYGIVQELRNTPQNLLFEVMQTITGSPINQKSFCLWKESFLAATRELQRIYGKEEDKQSQ